MATMVQLHRMYAVAYPMLAAGFAGTIIMMAMIAMCL
jgi:hypothetical protein